MAILFINYKSQEEITNELNCINNTLKGKTYLQAALKMLSNEPKRLLYINQFLDTRVIEIFNPPNLSFYEIKTINGEVHYFKDFKELKEYSKRTEHLNQKKEELTKLINNEYYWKLIELANDTNKKIIKELE